MIGSGGQSEIQRPVIFHNITFRSSLALGPYPLSVAEDGRAVAVVRRLWDAYLAGDVEGALQHFAPDAVWESPSDVGPTAFRGRDEIRLVLDTADRFSVRRVTLTGMTEMGSFVLAHGVVYAEQGTEVVVDRVTTWRFYLSGDYIVRVGVEGL